MSCTPKYEFVYTHVYISGKNKNTEQIYISKCCGNPE